MPPTLKQLIARPGLDLELVVPGSAETVPLKWVHSTDLANPTPFLEAGQMVLTTGTQFPVGANPDWFDEYVARLAARGVAAIGFGTEVMRSGIPADFAAACRRYGMPLVLVPYRIPFIAIIQWVAEGLNREARARDDWALKAQRAVSLAALGSGGLTDALVELSTQLERTVVLFDAGGAVTARFVPATGRAADAAASPGRGADLPVSSAIVTEARRLLDGGKRAGGVVDSDRPAVLQTLGRRDRLSGVLAVLGVRELDVAANAVVTGAVALAEVSLEQGKTLRRGMRALRRELLDLLLAGQRRAVERTLAAAGDRLPAEPVRVMVCTATAGARNRLEESLQRFGSRRGGAFLARADTETVVIVSDLESAALPRLIEGQAVFAGVSEVTTYAELPGALAQARRALRVAGSQPDGEQLRLVWADLATDGLMGFAERSQAVRVARQRLAPLLDDEGRELLRCARVWLDHNGHWEPAAKALGIHRHSLKARIDRVVDATGIPLDGFAERVQLWTMIEALEQGDGH